MIAGICYSFFEFTKNHLRLSSPLDECGLYSGGLSLAVKSEALDKLAY